MSSSGVIAPADKAPAPLNPAYRVEWRRFSELESVVGQWRLLADRAVEPNVFYEPSFALNAYRLFGEDAGAMLVWSRMGRLLGLFPARTERWRGGFSTALTGWTHPYAPLGTPLVDRDEAEPVITAWLDHLAQDPAMPPLLLLPLVPEHGPFAAALDASLARIPRPNAALMRHRRALLQPTNRDGYLDRSVPARKRKELRRQRRRLEEKTPVTFSTAANTSDIGAALQDFLALEASGWKGKAGTAIVSDPEIRKFVEVAIATLSSEGKARVDRIVVNNRAVAATITLTSGNTAWCWKIAYNEGLARFSPGVQLMLDLTESLLADSRIARVDSCATAGHPMIDHIWRERLALSDRMISVKPSAVPFAVARQLEWTRRALVVAAKRFRDWFRDWVRR